jgi:hypothetical protein
MVLTQLPFYQPFVLLQLQPLVLQLQVHHQLTTAAMPQNLTSLLPIAQRLLELSQILLPLRGIAVQLPLELDHEVIEIRYPVTRVSPSVVTASCVGLLLLVTHDPSTSANSRRVVGRPIDPVGLFEIRLATGTVGTVIPLYRLLMQLGCRPR